MLRKVTEILNKTVNASDNRIIKRINRLKNKTTACSPNNLSDFSPTN